MNDDRPNENAPIFWPAFIAKGGSAATPTSDVRPASGDHNIGGTMTRGGIDGGAYYDDNGAYHTDAAAKSAAVNGPAGEPGFVGR